MLLLGNDDQSSTQSKSNEDEQKKDVTEVPGSCWLIDFYLIDL